MLTNYVYRHLQMYNILTDKSKQDYLHTGIPKLLNTNL